MTFREFQEITTDRTMKWHGICSWSLSDWAVAMAGECGEACNVIKKMNRKRILSESDDPEYHELKAALAEEIADTVTYAFLLAERCGFDMDEIVTAKFNKVSKRHGFPHYIRKSGLHDYIREALRRRGELNE